MYAATLAGIAFGNSGVHVPHGMAYSVAGLVRDFRPAGYPQDEAIVPHGMSVIVNAPSVFRFTSSACPERHLHGASCLGAETRGAAESDAGEVLAGHLIRMMKQPAFRTASPAWATMRRHRGPVRRRVCATAAADQFAAPGRQGRPGRPVPRRDAILVIARTCFAEFGRSSTSQCGRGCVKTWVDSELGGHATPSYHERIAYSAI